VTFATRAPVRIGHVDFMGIVFYPRYFEMINGAVEDWFSAVTDVDFTSLRERWGLGTPTVRLDTEFLKPSRLGEVLDISVSVFKVGRSSCAVDYILAMDGEIRVKARGVLVCTDAATLRSRPWPDTIREKLIQSQTAMENLT